LVATSDAIEELNEVKDPDTLTANCAEPLMIPFGKFANTFAASVTSANASIPSNLFFNVVVKSFAV
jgi:hypothetical protein